MFQFKSKVLLELFSGRLKMFLKSFACNSNLFNQKVSDTILKVLFFHVEKNSGKNFLKSLKETFFQSLSRVLSNGMFTF